MSGQNYGLATLQVLCILWLLSLVPLFILHKEEKHEVNGNA